MSKDKYQTEQKYFGFSSLEFGTTKKKTVQPIMEYKSCFASCHSWQLLQWGQYVFDPLAKYENWLLVEMGAEYQFTRSFV